MKPIHDGAQELICIKPITSAGEVFVIYKFLYIHIDKNTTLYVPHMTRAIRSTYKNPYGNGNNKNTDTNQDFIG